MNQPVNRGNLSLDDYTYSTEPLDIAAGATVAASIQIEADSDFEILKRMVFFTNDTYPSTIDLTVSMPVTIQLTDTGSGRNLFNTPVMMANAFGTAQFPFILQQTKIFSARSVIGITITNNSAVDIVDLQLSFNGRKIFKQRQY